MDERAFSILRIMEATCPDTDHAVMQDAAIAIGAVYAEAAATPPAFAHMEAYLQELASAGPAHPRPNTASAETKTIREKVEIRHPRLRGGH